ncbi:MAG: hypothetical protein WD066_03975 [Planctomycetaceae bacterium]
MTSAAIDLLSAFERLSPSEKQEVTAEILRRSPLPGELSDAALHELADELFQAYDAEEAADAGPRA